MALNTPKRVRTGALYPNSPPESDCGLISPTWSNNISQLTNNSPWLDGSLSPVSSCGSPAATRIHNQQHSSQQSSYQYNSSGGGGGGSSSSSVHQECRENRRGRPRSEALTNLMIEGSTSPSAIKCGFCNRVFPREKSLQAHLRTHTGI